MSRLEDIKYKIATNKLITTEDVEWLITQLERMEQYRLERIQEANLTYQRCYREPT